MFKASRLAAAAAIAAIPAIAVVSTSSAADQYSPYTPATTPKPTTPVATTPVATTPPESVPIVVLNGVETAVRKAIGTTKFGKLLTSSVKYSIPAPNPGTYQITFLYRLPGGKYQAVASGKVTVASPSATVPATTPKTVTITVKPNKHGKSVLKKLKAQKKKVIKIHVGLSYTSGGKKVSTTVIKNIKN